MGDVLTIRKNPVTYTIRVLGLIGNRQPAKNVALYAENITPQEEIDRWKTASYASFGQRERGTGRPTKKERREVDDLMDDLFFDSEEFDE